MHMTCSVFAESLVNISAIDVKKRSNKNLKNVKKRKNATKYKNVDKVE